MERVRDKDIDRESLKTLVIAHGARPAARLAKMNVNTVLSLARRHGWKKGTTTRSDSPTDVISSPQTLATTTGNPSTESKGTSNNICTLTPSEALARSLQTLRDTSTQHLAEYVQKASSEAKDHPKPLSISRKVKDISDVHKALWPQENQRNDILQIGILVQIKEQPPDPAPAHAQVLDA